MPSTNDPVRIILRDGFLEVLGECRGLTDKLRYFRKEMQTIAYRRELVKRYENLYNVDENDPNHIVTMPGFAHKVLAFCREHGLPFEFADARTPMPPPDYEKAFKGLRDYQINLVGKMLQSGGGILSAGTGTGKTAVSAAIIRAYDRRELFSRGTPTCVFACPDRDINRKNWQEFQHWLPDREIGLIMSGTSHKPSDDVICCTIDSLENIDPDQVGILIVDEMHASAANTRAEKISEFRRAAKWGVSATATGRFDGADLVSEGLYGPIVAKFTYQDGVDSGALVPITVYWLPAPPPMCGLDMFGRFKKREAKIRHGILINDDYCRMVADILNCIPDDYQTLCMLQFLEEMHHIKRCCTDRVGIVHAETNPDKMVAYPSLHAIKPKERKEIYDAFHDGQIRCVISTHCWKQGVDFPGLDIVVNAGGGGSDIVAKQVPGRASRKSEGKTHAYVIDFMHPWDRENPVSGTGKPGPILQCDLKRRKAYKELGFEQCQIQSITELPFLNQQLAQQAPSVLWANRNRLL